MVSVLIRLQCCSVVLKQALYEELDKAEDAEPEHASNDLAKASEKNEGSMETLTHEIARRLIMFHVYVVFLASSIRLLQFRTPKAIMFCVYVAFLASSVRLLPLAIPKGSTIILLP